MIRLFRNNDALQAPPAPLIGPIFLIPIIFLRRFRKMTTKIPIKGWVPPKNTFKSAYLWVICAYNWQFMVKNRQNVSQITIGLPRYKALGLDRYTLVPELNSKF